MHFYTVIILFFNFLLGSNGVDLYPQYNVSIDPVKMAEWSDNTALAYVATVRLFDYDHHIFQYRRYPCQYFYTDEIQLHYNNETDLQCLYNATSDEYEYSFQLHFDSRHVEPDILRNVAIQCDYASCSLSLLNITYVYIGWNLRGRELNPDCSFDTTQTYNIIHAPYGISDWITLRCKSFSSCTYSKITIEENLPLYVQILYGSSFELQVPHCSLEKSLSHIIQTNLSQTNRLLQQIIDALQQASTKINVNEQEKLKEYVEDLSILNKDVNMKK